MIGAQEIMVIAGVALLIFGPRQLPKLARSAGESLREFRNVKKELSDGLDDVDDVAHAMTREVNTAVRDVAD